MDAKLKRAFKMSDMAEKEEEYKKLAAGAIKNLKKDDLLALAEHVIVKEGAEQAGRTYITPAIVNFIVGEVGKEIPEDADEAKFFDVDAQLEIANQLKSLLQAKAEDFPTQLMKACRLVSECHQANGDFREAARALSGFKFDGYRQQVQATASDKVRWYVDSAMFYLEVDDVASAAIGIKRAHGLVRDIEKNSELFIMFKTCYARVQDYQRNFLAAAREYHLLSQFYGIVEEAALLESLKFAVTCAILAPAGPERMRRLATLYADERVSQLSNFPMLEKMFKERIIRKQDVESFEKLLAPHQNAMVSGGQTVLSKAIVGHNLLAASRIYNNITFDELGTLLGISPQKAEKLARGMIEAGQMSGVIDQVEGLVEFKDSTGSLHTWDQQINDVCVRVNDVLETISKKHPQYEY